MRPRVGSSPALPTSWVWTFFCEMNEIQIAIGIGIDFDFDLDFDFDFDPDSDGDGDRCRPYHATEIASRLPFTLSFASFRYM
jgi:hypothetical protein